MMKKSAFIRSFVFLVSTFLILPLYQNCSSDNTSFRSLNNTEDQETVRIEGENSLAVLQYSEIAIINTPQIFELIVLEGNLNGVVWIINEGQANEIKILFDASELTTNRSEIIHSFNELGLMKNLKVQFQFQNDNRVFEIPMQVNVISSGGNGDGGNGDGGNGDGGNGDGGNGDGNGDQGSCPELDNLDLMIAASNISPGSDMRLETSVDQCILDADPNFEVGLTWTVFHAYVELSTIICDVIEGVEPDPICMQDNTRMQIVAIDPALGSVRGNPAQFTLPETLRSENYVISHVQIQLTHSNPQYQSLNSIANFEIQPNNEDDTGSSCLFEDYQIQAGAAQRNQVYTFEAVEPENCNPVLDESRIQWQVIAIGGPLAVGNAIGGAELNAPDILFAERTGSPNSVTLTDFPYDNLRLNMIHPDTGEIISIESFVARDPSPRCPDFDTLEIDQDEISEGRINLLSTTIAPDCLANQFPESGLRWRIWEDDMSRVIHSDRGNNIQFNPGQISGDFVRVEMSHESTNQSVIDRIPVVASPVACKPAVGISLTRNGLPTSLPLYANREDVEASITVFPCLGHSTAADAVDFQAYRNGDVTDRIQFNGPSQKENTYTIEMDGDNFTPGDYTVTAYVNTNRKSELGPPIVETYDIDLEVIENCRLSLDKAGKNPFEADREDLEIMVTCTNIQDITNVIIEGFRIENNNRIPLQVYRPQLNANTYTSIIEGDNFKIGQYLVTARLTSSQGLELLDREFSVVGERGSAQSVLEAFEALNLRGDTFFEDQTPAITEVDRVNERFIRGPASDCENSLDDLSNSLKRKVRNPDQVDVIVEEIQKWDMATREDLRICIDSYEIPCPNCHEFRDEYRVQDDVQDDVQDEQVKAAISTFWDS